MAHMRARWGMTGGEVRAVTAFLQEANGDDAPARVIYDSLVVIDTVLVFDTVVIVPSTPAAGRDSLVPRPLAPDSSAPVRATPAAVPRRPPNPQVERQRLTEEGRRLVAAKGCSGCHVIAGRGGTVGPSLDDLFARRDERYVRQKIVDPRLDNPTSVMPDFALSRAQAEAIVAYLRTVRRRP